VPKAATPPIAMARLRKTRCNAMSDPTLQLN
jgi:hypothetical protein